MSRIPKGFISLGTTGNLINSSYVSDIKYDREGKTLILKSGETLRIKNYIIKEDKKDYEAY